VQRGQPDYFFEAIFGDCITHRLLQLDNPQINDVYNKEKSATRQALMIDIPQADNKVRDRVIIFLLFLSSRTCIDTCSKTIPAEKLVFKLSEIWFTKIFVPGKVFINAVKSSYSEEESKRFQDCFDVEEYDVLERFNLFFDLRINMLSKKNKKNEVFPDSDLWKNIVKDARHVLDEIVSDQDLLRRQLEERVSQIMENNKSILNTVF
jgi:hypothetical protein